MDSLGTEDACRVEGIQALSSTGALRGFYLFSIRASKSSVKVLLGGSLAYRLPPCYDGLGPNNYL